MFRRFVCGLCGAILLLSCSDDLMSVFSSTDGTPISLSGIISQEYVTRANDDGFADGDQMGVYIVDYNGTQAGRLSASGNRANNALFQFDAKTLRWQCGTPFYWKDMTTHIDLYGYYPYTASILDVEKYLFTVADDQRAKGDGMSGYEKSDFLWAKTADVAQTTDVIKLNYTHRMAGVKVTLQRGDGFSQTEWGKVERIVTVDNTVRTAEINMTTGTVTATGKADKNIFMANQGDDVYRAVVVPQTVTTGTRLFGITIDGISYYYTRTQELALTSGKLHKFTLKIDKKDSGDYSVALISEEITPWENDNITHGFFEYEYTVVNTAEPGTLKQTIEAMGKDYTKLKNLKIVGPITDSDFKFMREEMSELAMLNMKEALLKSWTWYEWDQPHTEPDNMIPSGAFYGKRSLRRVILPDCTETIGSNAFREIGLDANSSIIIPPHVKRINEAAFGWNGEAGELVLNDSLEYIGAYALAARFSTCEYRVSENLKHMGRCAFKGISKMQGHFYLPDGIEYMEGIDFDGAGGGSWSGISFDEVGEIVVPKSITHITQDMFPGFSRGCYLTLHDGVKEVGTFANNCRGGFIGQRFINRVNLPEGLTGIGQQGFAWCNFAAGLSIPKTLRRLGGMAFACCNGLGDLELPEGITTIPGSCFSGSDLRSMVLPASVEIIEKEAFRCGAKSIKIGKYCSFIGNEAFGGELKSLILLNPEPPYIEGDPFRSCNFDHLVLEVPEQSVDLYRNTPGWNKIRFITAYHELAVGASELKCLDKGMTYETLVRAEGKWEVTECPSWCHVNPMSSEDRRTEVTITVDPTTQGTERNGKIVFKLKNADYTTYTTVTQSAYDKAQDTEILLQQASAGGKEIPIFLVGEGFDVPSIKDGTYMKAMNEAYKSIFDIEPFKSYKNYFTVSTAVAVSPDAGMESVTDMKTNCFGLYCDDFGMHIDWNKVKSYAKKVSSHVNNNTGNALIIVVPNFNAFTAMTQIDNDGCGMALCAYSQDTYPYDFRGLIQHYALGRVFGHLAYENLGHNTFLKACTCPGCSAFSELKSGQAKGWYQNVSLTGGLNSVPWKHLVFDSRYSDIVDAYEGGWNHLRGVYRSENMSVMNTYIQYFNTWCRELLVRRIMEAAGKQFNFEDFVSKDSREGRPE